MPLVEGIKNGRRTSVGTLADLEAILHLHHLILAVGNTAKGFPPLTAKSNSAAGRWVDLFKLATQTIIDALRVMSHIAIIREAASLVRCSFITLANLWLKALSAFKIMVASTGTAVLPYIHPFLDCIINQLKIGELADFMPFVSLLLNKYKVNAFLLQARVKAEIQA